MNTNQTKQLVFSALMAALTCIGTMMIQIPSPMNGYIHLGDGFVLLSGILLGPLYGSAAAGIGSMLADLLSGYPHYALGTFVIKACAAIVAAYLYSKLSKTKLNLRFHTVPVVLSGIASGIIVTLGYFLFSSLYLGKGIAAAASIPGNIIQNIFAILVSTILLPMLLSVPFIKDIKNITNNPLKR